MDKKRFVESTGCFAILLSLILVVWGFPKGDPTLLPGILCLLMGIVALCCAASYVGGNISGEVDGDEHSSFWKKLEQKGYGGNERWKEELEPASIEFLNEFFDDRRRQQWPLLLQSVASIETSERGSPK